VAILFFPEQVPGPAERVAEEELQPVVRDLEGAARDPALAQGKQIGADLLFTELVRLKVPLIWVEGRMKKKNPSSGIGLPKRIETAGFAL
jgi:hypothetical protein